MADKKIDIRIKTTKVGTGAEQTAADMQRLTAATAATTDKARVSEFAYYDLNAELGETNKVSQTFTAGQTQVQRSSRNSAQALYLFSQGFEDASYGIRGVLNNIPGLIIALGGTAGLAGAISIGAVALSQIIPLFTAVEEKAGDVADRIQETADGMAALDASRFEEVGEAIDAARDRAEALNQTFDDTRAAEQKFAQGAIENAQILAEVQRNVAAALGLQVDRYAELQAIAAAEEEKRKLAAEQAIAAEQQKLAVAEENLAKAEAYSEAQKKRAFNEEANLIRGREELNLLHAQKAALEEKAKFAGQNFPVYGGFGIDDAKIRDLQAQTSAGNAAAKQLKDPVLEAQIQGAVQKLDQLEGLVKDLTKDGGVVTRAENAVLAAQTKVTDVANAVAIEVEGIAQNAALQDLRARSQTLAASQEQQAKDLTEAVSKIETTTEAGRAAKASIQTAAADGTIAANESQQLAQDSVRLIGQIQGGLATAGTNTAEVLRLLRVVATREQSNTRELAEIRRQVENLSRP